MPKKRFNPTDPRTRWAYLPPKRRSRALFEMRQSVNHVPNEEKDVGQLCKDILCGVDALKKLGVTAEWHDNADATRSEAMLKYMIKPEHEVDVVAFLERPSSTKLLRKVVNKIEEIFGQVALRLEVEKSFSEISRCPDCEHHRAIEEQTLWVYIQTHLGAKEVIPLEDKYDEWHLDHMMDTDISVHIEFI